MDTIINIPKQLKLAGAMLAMAALVITLLAVTFATGPAQAQDSGNNYPNPQPCGPGAATAFQPEPHEVTVGHFALFDAYWEWTNKNPNEGIMHTNHCPPLMVETTQIDPVTEEETLTLTRSVSNIDIEEAIFHVLDKHKATVVATNAEATRGQLSLEEYPKVKEAAPAGSQVWWLRLDDPDTNADDTSDLTLGFSTALFDPIYWKFPMRYKFEVERYPGEDSSDPPHFFAYEAPLGDNEKATLVWSSIRPDIDDDDMKLDPGQYRALQWVFTEPGTYVLSVHLQGYVRQNRLAGAGEDWKPISSNVTETSEVKRYVIQVGDKLDEMEPPLFGVNLSVAENSPAGATVGSPIPVYNSEAATLEYKLAGEGHTDFKVVAATGPHSVQIAVADEGILDYETKPSYELSLSVSDKVDHENNPDPTVDDTLAVRIALTNVEESATVAIRASNSTPAPGEQVTIRAILGDVFTAYPGTVTQTWRERDKGASQWTQRVSSTPVWSFTAQHPAGVTKEYDLNLSIDDGNSTTFLGGGPITVSWANSPSN